MDSSKGSSARKCSSATRLAKAEIRECMARASVPATMVDMGSFIASYALGFILRLSCTRAQSLSLGLRRIVGGVLALLAAVILISASCKFTQVGAVPQRTVFCLIPSESAR
jgi:hypothetical protein